MARRLLNSSRPAVAKESSGFASNDPAWWAEATVIDLERASETFRRSPPSPALVAVFCIRIPLGRI